MTDYYKAQNVSDLIIRSTSPNFALQKVGYVYRPFVVFKAVHEVRADGLFFAFEPIRRIFLLVTGTNSTRSIKNTTITYGNRKPQ